MRSILGAVKGMTGRSLLLLCLYLSAIFPAYAQGEDLDAFKQRFTGSWWYSQPSGHFDGQNHEGQFDLSKDFHFGSYSTFTGTYDWRFKRKHHLLFGISPVSYSNRATLLRTIMFQGETYNVGTQVTSDLKSLSFAPGYQWDFIRRNHGSLSLATQFYMLDTKATLTGTVVVNGQTATRTASGSFFAPLPVIGLHGRWYPLTSDRLNVEGYINGMYFFGYGDFYSARGIAGFGITHHWKVIAGYHADLSSEALGFGVIAFIQVTLATHSPDNAKRFRALVNRIDEIQEAYSLTGDADYVLKAVLRDLKSLSDIVNNVLMPHPSVAHVRSSIVLDRLKESGKLPLRT